MLDFRTHYSVILFMQVVLYLLYIFAAKFPSIGNLLREDFSSAGKFTYWQSMRLL